MLYRLRNFTKNRIVADRVVQPEGGFSRAVGFLPRAQVAPDEGLWLKDSHAIHTVGMRATIDVVFVDRNGVVVNLLRDVPPMRPMIADRRASSVIELGRGAIVAGAVALGDVLVLEAHDIREPAWRRAEQRPGGNYAAGAR